MTKEERQFLLVALRAVESLHFRNAALESILEKFPPPEEQLPDWKNIAQELTEDQHIQPRLRERFRQIFAEFEDDQPPSQSAQQVLLNFLLSLPTKGKPN